MASRGGGQCIVFSVSTGGNEPGEEATTARAANVVVVLLAPSSGGSSDPAPDQRMPASTRLKRVSSPLSRVNGVDWVMRILAKRSTVRVWLGSPTRMSWKRAWPTATGVPLKKDSPVSKVAPPRGL